MLSLFEAQDIVLSKCSTLGTETVTLEDALGRVLAEEVTSNRFQPPYDVSAMDGYAVSSDDFDDGVVTLKIADDIRAGMTPSKKINKGEAAIIMTGAEVPVGTDTVIRIEDTDGGQEVLKINKFPTKGRDIRKKGENIKKGDIVLSVGDTINPGALATLVMVKKREVSVFKMPTVSILSTGDELESIEEELDARKIPDTNSYAVMAQLKAIGVSAKIIGIAKDTPEDTEAKIKEGLKSDILIVSGGVSVGVHDFVKPILEGLGIKIHFWKAAIRPGKPIAFGTKKESIKDSNNEKLVFGLPGNPVSSMVCVEQFVIPALRKTLGFKTLFRQTSLAELKEDFKNKSGRTNFARVKVSYEDNNLKAANTGSQGSGILMSMVEADGFMVIPSDTGMLKSGTKVKVQILDSGFQNERGYNE